MTLSEAQIGFIRNDIVARGITLESLQDDLTDHICCLLEIHPGAAGNFDAAYNEIIQTFYKQELKEIETETLFTLNHKTRAMKKSMMITGLFAAGLLSLGIVLKFMHAPGAGAAIVSGTFFFSMVFLPLLAIIRMKEKNTSREKMQVALGVLAAIPLSLSFVFRIQHWPGAMILLYLSIGIALLLFLPLYLARGIKNPETKMQTLVVSIILVTGCGLWLSLVASPAGMQKDDAKNMETYKRSQQILNTEKQQLEKLSGHAAPASSPEKSMYNQCEMLKMLIVLFASSNKSSNSLSNTWLNNYFAANPTVQKLVNELNTTTSNYNKLGSPNPIPQIFQDMENEKSLEALTAITQVQMILLQNEREKI